MAKVVSSSSSRSGGSERSSSKQKTWTKNNSTTTNKYLTTKGQRKTYKQLTNALTGAENKVNTLTKQGFNNPYKNQMNNTVNAINNSKFEYSVNDDALYNQYKEIYQNMGNTAMQEAQADATALTGGFSNSYAQTAGTKAYASYITQLQNLVPQLYSQARTTYDTNLSNLYNKANLYSGLGTQAFNEWQTNLNQAVSDRDYAYNKAYNYKMSTQKSIAKEKGSQKTSGKTSGRSSSYSSSSSTSKKSKK